MKKINQNSKGFAVVESILILIIIAAIMGTGWYVYNARGNSTDSLNNADKANSSTLSKSSISTKGDYISYENKELGLSFLYPKTWNKKDISADSAKTGTIVDLVSPEQHEGYEKFIALKKATEGPIDSDLVVSHWPSINNNYARGGSWLGMNENYKNLAEFFADPHSTKQKVDTMIINNTKAYQVIIGGFGQNYGLMYERDNGIFEFNFINVQDKDHLTEQLNSVIRSIKFD